MRKWSKPIMHFISHHHHRARIPLLTFSPSNKQQVINQFLTWEMVKISTRMSQLDRSRYFLSFIFFIKNDVDRYVCIQCRHSWEGSPTTTTNHYITIIIIAIIIGEMEDWSVSLAKWKKNFSSFSSLILTFVCSHKFWWFSPFPNYHGMVPRPQQEGVWRANA